MKKTPNSGFSPLVKRLADAVQEAVGRSGQTHLPSIRNLAGQYHVSYVTMTKVMKLLKLRGVVEMYPGRRAEVSNGLPELQSQPSPSERLYQELRDRILNGDILSGSQLPKLDFWRFSRSISTRCVRDAYRMLVTNGLAHRNGRFWFAGREPVISDRNNEPFIVLCLPRYKFWKGLCQSLRTRQFCESFMSECIRHNVRLIPLYARSERTFSGDDTITPMEVYDWVESISGRYQGTLVCGKRTLFNDIEHWLTSLHELGRPVVWLDSVNEGFQSGALRKNVFRCWFDEPDAVRCALDYLLKAGHSNILFMGDFEQKWVQRRWQILQDEGRKKESGLVLRGKSILDRAFWTGESDPNVSTKWDTVTESENPVITESLKSLSDLEDSLVSELPESHPLNHECDGALRAFRILLDFYFANRISLADDRMSPVKVIWAAFNCGPFLSPVTPTAIIGANDQYCESYIKPWLSSLAIAVPGEVSLISFDNSFRYDFHSLNSVDFGFDSLGYRAFHAILEDLPLQSIGKEISSHSRISCAGKGHSVKRHV